MLYFIFALIIILGDQVTKYLVTLNLAYGAEVKNVIPNIVGFEYVKNTGGAFSYFSDYTQYLAIASAVIIVVLLVILFASKMGPFGKLSLGFIIGGAIGNLIDRFFLGYVVDFIRPLFIDFAVFNVADIFITVGVIFLACYIIFTPSKKKQAEKAAKEIENNEEFKDVAYRWDTEKRSYEVNTQSTIVVPSKEKKAEKTEPAEEPKQAEKPATREEKRAAVKETEPLDVEAIRAEVEEAKDVPAPEAGEHEFTLEEILKEFGHDGY